MVAKALEPRNAYRYKINENRNLANHSYNGNQSFQSLDSPIKGQAAFATAGKTTDMKIKIAADPNLVLLQWT